MKSHTLHGNIWYPPIPNLCPTWSNDMILSTLYYPAIIIFITLRYIIPFFMNMHAIYFLWGFFQASFLHKYLILYFIFYIVNHFLLVTYLTRFALIAPPTPKVIGWCVAHFHRGWLCNVKAKVPKTGISIKQCQIKLLDESIINKYKLSRRAKLLWWDTKKLIK